MSVSFAYAALPALAADSPFPTLKVFYKLNVSTRSKLIKVRVIHPTYFVVIPYVPVPRLYSTPVHVYTADLAAISSTRNKENGTH